MVDEGYGDLGPVHVFYKCTAQFKSQSLAQTGWGFNFTHRAVTCNIVTLANNQTYISKLSDSVRPCQSLNQFVLEVYITVLHDLLLKFFTLHISSGVR